MVPVESILKSNTSGNTFVINRPEVKLVCAFVLGLAVGIGCGSYDSFHSTTATFELDKTSYWVGDTITLTLTLTGEDSVRFHENVEKTLHIWLGFRKLDNEPAGHLSYTGIESVEIEPRDGGGIRTYQLTKDIPLKLEFTGTLNESDDSSAFTLSFPTLNFLSRVQKEAYAKAIALEIHGHLMPIKPYPVDALEDFVGSVRLTIQPR